MIKVVKQTDMCLDVQYSSVTSWAEVVELLKDWLYPWAGAKLRVWYNKAQDILGFQIDTQKNAYPIPAPGWITWIVGTCDDTGWDIENAVLALRHGLKQYEKHGCIF